MATTAAISDTKEPGRWARWKRVGLDVFKTFTDPDTAPRCAATAFFGFLSIFPALIHPA